MNEPVDRVIQERERMDAGLRGGMVLSVAGHLVLAGAAVAAPFLFPPTLPLRVADGFAVALPRGGGGAPQPPPAVEVQAPAPPPVPPAAPEPPKVLKPPKEEPRAKGLPELDARKSSKKKLPEPPVGRAKSEKATAGSAKSASAPSQTPGLEFGPPGPGVPEGTDSGGDWYLAGVQQKIWIVWNQQIKSGFTEPVSVVFTILADGSVTDVSVVQSSGATLLDLAAKRAVYSAAPFGPLPKDYGTNRKTIQALFKPAS